MVYDDSLPVTKMRLALLAVLLASGLSPRPAHAKCAEESISVFGSVLDYSRKSAPIQGAKIYLTANDGGLINESVVTRSNGHFQVSLPTFRNEQEGCRDKPFELVTLIVFKEGYYSEINVFYPEGTKGKRRTFSYREGIVSLSPITLFSVKPK